MEPETKPSWPSRISYALRRLREILSSFWTALLLSFSKLRTPIQKAIDSVRPQDSTNNKRTDSQDKKPDSIPPKPNSPPSPPDKKKTRKRCQKLLPIATFVVEVLALLGLMVYACLTYKMWREMQEQTGIQQAAQRPWLGIGDVEILNFDRKTGQINFVLQFINSGTTPALNIIEGSKTGVVQAPPNWPGLTERENFVFEGNTLGAIPPQGNRKLLVSNDIPKGNGPAALPAINNHAGVFFYRGELRYLDNATRQTHTTRFCLYLPNPDILQWAFCPTGNDMN